MVAAFGAGLSYIYQSLIAGSLWNRFYSEFPNPGEPPSTDLVGMLAKVIKYIVIFLVFLSYTLFGYGAWFLVSDIAGLYSFDG